MRNEKRRNNNRETRGWETESDDEHKAMSRGIFFNVLQRNNRHICASRFPLSVMTSTIKRHSRFPSHYTPRPRAGSFIHLPPPLYEAGGFGRLLRVDEIGSDFFPILYQSNTLFRSLH